MTIQHLSYSSINTYLTCPEQWRRKYIMRQPTKPTPALVFGGAFHNTVERYISQEERSESLTDIWPNIWEEKLATEPTVEWGDDTPAGLYADGLRMFGNADVREMVDSVTPYIDDRGPMVERKVEMRVPGVPVPVIGYIDVITDDFVPGDFKTSSSSWSEDKAQSELQPLFYLAGLDQAGFKLPDLRFRHYVFVKTKQPKVQVIEHVHTWNEVLWMFQMIRRAWESIEAGIFPLNPGGWACNPKYCSYWSTCRGWAFEL